MYRYIARVPDTQPVAASHFAIANLDAALHDKDEKTFIGRVEAIRYILPFIEIAQ